MCRITQLALVVLLLVACGSPDEPGVDTTEDVWSMTFVQLRHDRAVAPPYPDSTPFTATLRRKRANQEWTLLGAGATYSSLYAHVPNVDSTQVSVVVGAAPWRAWGLNVTYSGGTVSGSYTMSISAQGAQASGTFTGQRQ